MERARFKLGRAGDVWAGRPGTEPASGMGKRPVGALWPTSPPPSPPYRPLSPHSVLPFTFRVAPPPPSPNPHPLRHPPAKWGAHTDLPTTWIPPELSQERLAQSELLIARLTQSWEEKEREGRELEAQRRELMREMGLSVSEEDMRLPQVEDRERGRKNGGTAGA